MRCDTTHLTAVDGLHDMCVVVWIGFATIEVFSSLHDSRVLSCTFGYVMHVKSVYFMQLVITSLKGSRSLITGRVPLAPLLPPYHHLSQCSHSSLSPIPTRHHKLRCTRAQEPNNHPLSFQF